MQQAVSCGRQCPKSSGISKQGQIEAEAFHFPYQKEKEEEKNSSIFSHFPQQLACPVPAATVDLGPLVEGGGDQIFLFEAQPAHARHGVVAAGP